MPEGRVDVLLVYPVWVRRGGRGRLQRMLPPLGLLSIASYLESRGFAVRVLDLHARMMSPEEFRAEVRMMRPRFVGISVLSPHVVPARRAARICKEEVPDAVVCVGGVHADAEPEQMLAERAIDAVCRGDGEETMLELVQGAPLERIQGLSFRAGNGVVHNPSRAAVMDLDRFPFPAYHLVDLEHYLPPMGSYRRLPAVNLLMTRGCPGRCTFCNSAMTPLRSRSVEKMVELIRLLRDRHGIRQVYFYDDTFTAVPQRVREFCRRMISEKVGVQWICYVRGDMFGPELAELMSSAGCHQVLMGVESGSQELTAGVGKPIPRRKYIDAAAAAHRFGIEVRASFIIGHRRETRESLRDTLRLAEEMDADFLQLNVMTPYPGTALFQEAKRDGSLLHEDYSRYGQNEIVLKPEFLAADEIHAFMRRAYLQFYLRPRSIWRQLRRLRHWTQLRDLGRAASVLFPPRAGGGDEPPERLRGWLECA